jgi:hypothetical protein
VLFGAAKLETNQTNHIRMYSPSQTTGAISYIFFLTNQFGEKQSKMSRENSPVLSPSRSIPLRA